MIRRRTLEFDDVMNQQREVIYGYRQEVMDSENPRELVFEVIDEMVPKKVAEYLEQTDSDEPDRAGLLNWVNTTFPLGLSAKKAALDTRSVEENGAWLVQIIKDAYNRKASMEHAEALRGLERFVILNAVDRLWQEHLYAMDGLREAVYLRAFAQKDPLVEYKNEAFSMFGDLMDSIKLEVLNNLFRSTTNFRLSKTCCEVFPKASSKPMFPGSAVRRRPLHRRQGMRSRRRPKLNSPSNANFQRSAATSRARAAAEKSSRTAAAGRHTSG